MPTGSNQTPARTLRSAAAAVLTGLALTGGTLPEAAGQATNPVYLDVAPRAVDTLESLDVLVASENWAEAVRAVQRMLDEHSGTVVLLEGSFEPNELADFGPVASGGSVLAGSLRERVHGWLLSQPEVLERYRETLEPRALRGLNDGRHGWVVRSMLLTPSGIEAALRVAQQKMEEARFHSARELLESLERHPDFASYRGEIAGLGAALARFLPEGDGFDAVVQRWSQEAGRGAPDLARSPVPVAAATVSIDPYDTAGPVVLDAIPPTPLESLLLDEGVELGPNATEAERRIAQQRASSGSDPNVMPRLVGDTVFFSDGRTVRAIDRFTLGPIWTARLPDAVPQNSRRINRMGMDRPHTVALEGDPNNGVIVVAEPGDGESDGTPLVYGLSSSTGEILWVQDITSFDSRLESAVVYGPGAIGEGLIVLPVRRFVQSRRIMSAYLVAIEVATGEPAWVTLLGSVGSLPYQQGRPSPSRSIIDRGTVYRCDGIGVIAALDLASGEPRWVRTEPATQSRARSGDEPWASMQPHLIEIDGQRRLVTLDPSKSRLLAIDPATGRVVDERSSGALGSPVYTLETPDHLAAVGQVRILFVPKDNIFEGDTEATRFFRDAQPYARAVVSGDRVLLPTTEGLTLINPADPQVLRTVRLDERGNALIASGQVILATSSWVHSFLGWEEAARVLGERMTVDPQDPAPPLTLARLAYRSERFGLIVDALDAARRAAGRPGWVDARNEPIGQVFDAASGIVAVSHRDAGLSELEAPRIENQDLLGELIERMLLTAQNPDEQAEALLAQGRHDELGGRYAQAIDAYQEILSDVDLASATWSGSGPAVRASAESIRRIESIVSDSGAGVYASYDAEARLEDQLLDPGAGPELLEELALRLPASEMAAAWWFRAGGAWRDSERPHEAVRSLNRALRSTELDQRAGRNVSEALLGETFGLLLTTLLEAERPNDAAKLLVDERLTSGRIVPIYNGIPLALDQLSDEVTKLIQGRRRLPSIGAVTASDVEASGGADWFEGWVVLQPTTTLGATAPVDALVMWNAIEGLVGLWNASADGTLEPAWARRVGLDFAPVLLRHDDRAVFLVHRSEGSVTLDRVDAATGELDWTVDSVAGALLEDAEILRAVRGRGGPAQLDTFRGQLPADELLTVMDGQSVAFVERTGRTAVFDLLSGELLWSDVLPVRVVNDASLSDGMLFVCGNDAFGFDAIDQEPEALAIALDARSGKPLRTVMAGDGIGAEARWVRGGPDSTMLIGSSDGVISVGVLRGGVLWELKRAVVETSRHAWVFGEKLYVMGRTGELVIVDARGGEFDPGPIRSDGRIGHRRMIRAVPVSRDEIGEVGTGPDAVVFTSRRGMIVTGGDGSLRGIDALDGAVGLVPPVVGLPTSVGIDATGRNDPDGFGEHDVYFFETASGMLAGEPLPVRLPAAPRSIMALDGIVVISTEFGTAAFRAPAPTGEDL